MVSGFTTFLFLGFQMIISEYKLQPSATSAIGIFTRIVFPQTQRQSKRSIGHPNYCGKTPTWMDADSNSLKLVNVDSVRFASNYPTHFLVSGFNYLLCSAVWMMIPKDFHILKRQWSPFRFFLIPGARAKVRLLFPWMEPVRMASGVTCSCQKGRQNADMSATSLLIYPESGGCCFRFYVSLLPVGSFWIFLVTFCWPSDVCFPAGNGTFFIDVDDFAFPRRWYPLLPGLFCARVLSMWICQLTGAISRVKNLLGGGLDLQPHFGGPHLTNQRTILTLWWTFT